MEDGELVVREELYREKGEYDEGNDFFTIRVCRFLA